VVNTPVDGLYVNPVSVLGERLPVAALANRGYLVALVVLSAVNVTADEYVAVSALPVTLPVTLPVNGPANDVAVTAPVMPTVPVSVVLPVILVAACSSIVAAPMGFKIKLALDDVLISAFSIMILLIEVRPIIVGVVICGEVNVVAELSSPYNSAKLSLILLNAVRNGSPVPSFAEDPILIVCFGILIIYQRFYKPNVIFILLYLSVKILLLNRSFFSSWYRHKTQVEHHPFR
jgi:hypothetical protein